MKLIDLYEAKLEKAKDRFDLEQSITLVHGVFGKDGTDLKIPGDFRLFERGLSSLKGCPSVIPGDFDCQRNNLKTLEGGPIMVHGEYRCENNLLISLKGAPKIALGGFVCASNGITTLDGAPEEFHNSFNCEDNRLTSLKDIHKHIKYISGTANFEHNPIKSHVLGLLKIKKLEEVALENEKVQNIINKYLPEGDMLACIDELEDAGFEEYAKL